MLDKKSLLASLSRLTSLAVVLLALSVAGFGQDPSGRPTDPKGKKTTKKTGKVEPQPITIMLTVLTDPPESEVYINGEKRGVTNSEGKIQLDKLALGHYSIEVRKEGYSAMLRGFEAGTESPTKVFKLEPKFDDYIKQFNSLVAAGKLAGSEPPNAVELVQSLATKFPNRPEVTQLSNVLAAKLIETATPVIAQTVANWRGVTREQMVQAQDAAVNALALKKDDTRIQTEAAYLRGVVALREWQTGSVSTSAKGDAAGPAESNGSGPAAARAEFETALKLQDSFTAARYQLGIVLLASSDPSGAEAALVKVTQAEPAWASAHTALGAAYYGQGKFREAIDTYRKAIEIDASNATALAGLGLARVGKGDKDGIKEIERAIKADPNSALAHLNLAIACSQLKSKKDWSRSQEEFKKAIQLNSQNLEFQNSAAERMLAEVQKRKK
jgi:Flp pilus assembly protein TadD